MAFVAPMRLAGAHYDASCSFCEGPATEISGTIRCRPTSRRRGMMVMDNPHDFLVRLTSSRYTPCRNTALGANQRPKDEE